MHAPRPDAKWPAEYNPGRAARGRVLEVPESLQLPVFIVVIGPGETRDRCRRRGLIDDPAPPAHDRQHPGRESHSAALRSQIGESDSSMSRPRNDLGAAPNTSDKAPHPKTDCGVSPRFVSPNIDRPAPWLARLVQRRLQSRVWAWNRSLHERIDHDRRELDECRPVRQRIAKRYRRRVRQIDASYSDM